MVRRWSNKLKQLLGLILFSLTVLCPQTVDYDLVIRNGRVLDGNGNPWIRADVAIKNGRFVLIGKVDGRGKREIDASGKYISPGWIDMLDQSGGSLLRNGLGESKLKMGVTTGIGGEAGTPVAAEKLPEYFAELEKGGISMNFGTAYNESQARVEVLGYAAREPNAEELARMQSIMETAMKNGALGMTTALIYPPGSYAATAELIAMAKAAAKYGGIYSTHMRGEGAELVQSIDEAIAIGEQGGLPVEIFHLKAAYEPGWGKLMTEAGKRIEQARARGLDIAADMYLYTAGGTSLDAVIPSWAHEGGTEALLKRLEDPDVRVRLKKETQTGSPGWWNLIEASGGWKHVILASTPNEEDRRFIGKSIAVIAEETGRDGPDTAYDLVLRGKDRCGAIYFMMSEADIETAVKFPWVSLGSDSAAMNLPPGGSQSLGHPRAYGNFPRLIAAYVRDKHVITLEDAIRKMTSWPATRMRLANRGSIKEGMWADVVIFDLARIQDRSTYEQPTLPPEGIDYVVVNGQVVIDQGKHTGAKPGQVLYGPGRQKTSDTISAGPGVR
jgi:N-acyl-D-aspartate/D-glutamate deacylase